MKALSILVEDFIRGLPEQQVKKGQFNGCIVREIEDPVIVGQIMQLCQQKLSPRHGISVLLILYLKKSSVSPSHKKI